MSFFKNKHVITAMIVAPLLALATYYIIDLVVKESPQKAVAGNAYKLVAKSNCRFTSGTCDLVNGSFTSEIRVEQSGNKQLLRLTTSHELQNARIGFVTSNGEETNPVELIASDDSLKQWELYFNHSADANTAMRIALTADGAHYLAETTMTFGSYETSFGKDLRKQTREQ